MKTYKNSIFVLFLGVLLTFSIMDCSTMNIGEKPIVTMQDVKELSAADVANLAKTLHNSQAEWYKDRISRWTTLTKDQQEQTVDDYELLCKSWPTIALYDRLTKANQPVSPELKTDVYRFIEQHLGGK